MKFHLIPLTPETYIFCLINWLICISIALGVISISRQISAADKKSTAICKLVLLGCIWIVFVSVAILISVC